MKGLKLKSGPIAYMANHRVAANLLMLACIVGGLIMATRIKQEVFPEFELDIISVVVPYPGASPSEVEQGIVLVTEEAVRSLEGVKRVTASAYEGAGRVALELLDGADPDRALSDVKAAVDRIVNFPEDAERPTVSLALNRTQVISLVVYGDLPEKTLRAFGERTREDLLALEEITQVELTGIRPREVAIEVPQENLRRFDLTLPGIARQVAGASIELPAGGVDTAGGEVLLRTAERRDLGEEFAEIALISRPDGTRVKLADVAEVTDGFQETDESARFNGKPAVQIQVYRVGDQTPIEIADAVRRYIAERAESLPPGVQFSVWDDRSRVYRDRIDLLTRNAKLGLILVFLVLGAFLEIKLAYWVMLGIPISFLGAFLLMPMVDVSLNMISLFAFIVTLGIVVDDAIVVGESIYEKQEQSDDHSAAGRLRAAIAGAREVSTPVIFAVLTTVVAFSPLLFVPGISGKIFRVIPLIVISVLLLSLVESLFVLPAHLAHTKKNKRGGLFDRIDRPQRWVANQLSRFIKGPYRRAVTSAIRWRYLTFALGLASLIITVGLVAGGKVNFTFLPRVESDLITVTARLPFGAPAEDTAKVQAQLIKAARQVVAEVDASPETFTEQADLKDLPDSISLGIFSSLGKARNRGGPVPRQGNTGSHITAVTLLLIPSGERQMTTRKMTNRWRKAVGPLPGVETLSFRFSNGPGAGQPIDVQLTHPDVEALEAAAADLAKQLQSFNGVKDIDPGFSLGKRQLNFKLTSEGRSLGLTETELARQLRGAFYGAEALRQQRGRDEVRVMVRLPEAARSTEASVERFIVRVPGGGEIPLAQAATWSEGRAYTEIKREDGRRVLNVTADIEEDKANADKTLGTLSRTVMPQLLADHPGLRYEFAGERRNRNESLSALGKGFRAALIVIFALLAIPFRSYIQPAIVMSVIPFGIVGAVVGHMVLGYNLSIISLMGIVALSGVVVNDSLILIVAINTLREEGVPLMQAVVQGGVRRFRPILLTSLTTFFGLMPMIFETSVQARFLIPMAVSLGFGVLFVTVIVLLIVPALYVIIEDIRRIAASIKGLYTSQPAEGLVSEEMAFKAKDA